MAEKCLKYLSFEFGFIRIIRITLIGNFIDLENIYYCGVLDYHYYFILLIEYLYLILIKIPNILN